MDWLTTIKGIARIFPFQYREEKKTIVKITKVNTFDLKMCHPKGIIRERSFWRTEKVDMYHLLADGSIRHTPG